LKGLKKIEKIEGLLAHFFLHLSLNQFWFCKGSDFGITSPPPLLRGEEPVPPGYSSLVSLKRMIKTGLTRNSGF
jgi:hypothetical protein